MRSELRLAGPAGIDACPFCGIANSRVFRAGPEFYVGCSVLHCESQGPARATEAEAVAAWNCRPTPFPSPESSPPGEAPEKAVVFHGRCPVCGDFPTGEWHDGAEFTSDCGHELVAEVCDGEDGAEHWRFTRVTYQCEDCGKDTPPGAELSGNDGMVLCKACYDCVPPTGREPG